MPPVAAGSPPLVAIVDDDPSVCRALQRLVESAGFAVATFSSGHEVLDFGLGARTACFVVDVYLSDMTGFELRRLLMAHGVSVPMIFITAYDDPSTADGASRAGAVAYLSKPIDGEVLLDAIRRALRGRPPSP